MTVFDQANRPVDLEGGELMIDLAKWCEDRRVAEGASSSLGVFREIGMPLKLPSRSKSIPNDTFFGRALPRRGSLSVVGASSPGGSSANSSANSSPSGSPRGARRKKSNPLGGSESEETNDSVDGAMEQLQRYGIDNVEYVLLKWQVCVAVLKV